MLVQGFLDEGANEYLDKGTSGLSGLGGRGGGVVLGIGGRGEYEAAEADTADAGAEGMISFSLLSPYK